VVTAIVATELHLPLPLAIVAGMATGSIAGLTNGVLIAKLKIPSFIATLGMLNVAKGLALVISGLRPIYFNDTPEFNRAAMSSVLGTLIPGLDVPNIVIVLFACAVLASLVLTRTILGRYTFALGSNEEAARLSGVNVDAWKIAVFALAGLFSGIAGVVIGARLNSAQPSLGLGYELDAIAAAVIGGTSLSGGVGTVSGTLIGAFVIGILRNGLNMGGVSAFIQQIVIGLVILLTVWIDQMRQRR